MPAKDPRAGKPDRILKMGMLFHQPERNNRGEYVWGWSTQSDSWWEIKRGFTGWPAAPTGPLDIVVEDEDGTRKVVEVDPDAVRPAHLPDEVARPTTDR